MNSATCFTIAFLCAFSLSGPGCGNGDSPSASPKPADKGQKVKAAAPATPPQAVKEPLQGGALPSVLLAQAWFWKDSAGKSNPGPARLEIWRQGEQGWKATRLEDSDSNVFHKAIPYKGGIITIGAEQAMLKKWTWGPTEWKSETLWQKNWGGKFNRLRDIEIGDVNGDGHDEFVIATHDSGVIAVYSPDTPGAEVVELDAQPDTFVHEIEIGDIDGDGKNEFFATPSGRNKADASQAGGVVMYRWNGTTYVRSVVQAFTDTHAKEILVTDLNGDKKAELLVALEAATGADKSITKPVEIRHFVPKRDGSFESKVIATINDRQNRFLVPGDFDGDGEVEIVAAAMKSGLWLLDRNGAALDGTWTVTNFDTTSSGFEHVANHADLDNDGKVELYVAADDQQSLSRYTWDPTTSTMKKEKIGSLAPDTFTWNMEFGTF